MNYHVIWLPAAEQELAEIWLDPAVRANVTRASNALEVRLQRNAPNEGESRTGDLRIIFELPLVASFWVEPGGREVRVLHVWIV